MNKDNTEKIVAFMEQTEKMGKQLRATFEHQRRKHPILAAFV